jgi:hypothetical protein
VFAGPLAVLMAAGVALAFADWIVRVVMAVEGD